jgi:outer membrane protein assembly factor BamD
MRKIFFLLLVAITFTSCSEYQKALNRDDLTNKYYVGEKLYNEGKYNKALRLFDQMAPAYRGKPQAEKMFYMQAKSSFELKQYGMSGYLFERFVTNYPRSEKLEEAWMLSGKSFALLSPKYSKDQQDTYRAIDKLQEFINLYPESPYADEANKIIGELSLKLEKKYFEIAKQYNTIAGYTRDYKAAIVALDNFMIDYPGTIYTEDALYYKFDSMYHMAINSVPEKKNERLQLAVSAYENLLKHKSDTKYKEQADKMLSKLNEELQKS